MISEDLIQKAILTKLKADATLITLIGSANNIKESQWQGTTFSYPAIRVGSIRQSPVGNTGNSRTRLSNILFAVESFSEDASSKEVKQINNRVYTVLFDTEIYGLNDSNVHTFNILKIDLISSGESMRLQDDLWYQQSNFTSEVHSIT